jgi:hypothetical protein
MRRTVALLAAALVLAGSSLAAACKHGFGRQ